MSRAREKKNGLDPWIEGYLDYLSDVRRMAPRSTVDIRCTLKRVSEKMSVIRPGIPLWRVSLRDYLRWIDVERGEGLSTASLAKDISHIRGLLDYAWRSGRADRNVLDGLNLQDARPRPPARVLSVEEAKRLLDACGRRNRSQRRDRMMILMLYGCGIRTGELCRLNVQDVDAERQEILVQGKGDRQRLVPVPNGVWIELLVYMSERRGKRGPLFRTEKMRKRISAKDVCEVVKQTVQRAGIEGGVTAKTLRHSFATHLMDQGVDLAVIASLMGHRSPTETGVYLHVLPGRREEAVDKLDNSRRVRK